MRSSRLFITGCDVNTQWMLPWFVENFKKHNPNEELVIYDFGMEGSLFPEMRKSLRGNQDKGWFKKPAAMLNACLLADNVCWIDTDCHVVADISGIWDHVVPNKLTMAEDLPWSTRSKEKWHNSGVVAFKSIPPILKEWAAAVATSPVRGDQETLHTLLRDSMRRLTYINDLPRQYNVLRIDHIDGTVPKDPKIFHWTGQKGKDKIRSLMSG